MVSPDHPSLHSRSLALGIAWRRFCWSADPALWLWSVLHVVWCFVSFIVRTRSCELRWLWRAVDAPHNRSSAERAIGHKRLLHVALNSDTVHFRSGHHKQHHQPLYTPPPQQPHHTTRDDQRHHLLPSTYPRISHHAISTTTTITP